MYRFLIAMMLFVATAANAQTLISSTTTTRDAVNKVGAFTRTEMVFQDGADTRNRFTVTRVKRANKSAAETRGPVLLLPGSSATFLVNEATLDTYDRSLAGFLAKKGFDVWGYSPRTKGIPAGGCDPGGGFDCSIMSTWGMDTVVADVEFIRGLIEDEHPCRPPVVGGWSLGAVTAEFVVGQNPSGYAGLLVIEGLVSSNDTVVLAANATACAAANAQIALGQVVGGQAVGGFLAVAALPEPLRASILIPATSTPQPAPPAPVPNYTYTTPTLDLLGNIIGYKYADYPLLVNIVQTSFNPYESALVSRDWVCSIAGDTTLRPNLASFTAPILSIGGGRSMGLYQGHSIGLTGSTAVTTIFDPDFGHGDHFVRDGRVHKVWKPIEAWLSTIYP